MPENMRAFIAPKTIINYLISTMHINRRSLRLGVSPLAHVLLLLALLPLLPPIDANAAAGAEGTPSGAAPRMGAPSTPSTSLPAGFLQTNGSNLRDRAGNLVRLRGVNLGGWLEWQRWMCPMETTKTLPDLNPGHNGYDFEVRRLLTKRFGESVADDLLNQFMDAWIGERDIEIIAALGLNAVRAPFGYDTLLKEDGTWRPDAFKRLDWLAAAAGRHGLYVILDYHAFLPPGANHDGGASGYWKNAARMDETVRIWKRVAEHFRGNPVIAMYDLLNEPNNSHLKNKPEPDAADVRDLYDRLYKAIRAIDPEHIIAMEGVWNWHTLRDPARAGYRNVAYSFHWYHYNTRDAAERIRATDGDLDNIAKMWKQWNIPVYVGEFNLFGDQDAWKHAIKQYDQAGLSWTVWTYKSTVSGTNSWGVYTTIPGKKPPVPDIFTDSAADIRRKWKAWETKAGGYALNPFFKTLFAAPVKTSETAKKF